MTKNWIAANLILLLIAILLGWQLHLSIGRFNVLNDPARFQPVQDLRQKLAQDAELAPLPPPKRYDAAEFAVIPSQNLFSETRTKEEKAEAAPAVLDVPALQIKPILVGVTISGNQRFAAILDPANTTGGRRSQTKRLGDSFQGYIVTDITQNQMVLESGTRREVIPLFDNSKHPGPQGKTAILQTRVVSIGGSGAGGGAGAAATGSQAALGPNTRTLTPPPPAMGPGAGAQSGIARTTPVGGRQTPGTPAVPGQATQPAQASPGDPGSRIIRTPFGDIVRPN